MISCSHCSLVRVGSVYRRQCVRGTELVITRVMRYYVACVHSSPNDDCNARLPAGYGLSASELRSVCAQAGGAPFTYEHLGVHEAVAVIGQRHVTPAAMHAELNKLSVLHPTKAVIGSVLSAFIGHDDGLWCILILDESTSPRIDGLICSGRLTGVSLTHVTSTLACVEVALTSDPARENARIRYD